MEVREPVVVADVHGLSAEVAGVVVVDVEVEVEVVEVKGGLVEVGVVEVKGVLVVLEGCIVKREG